MQKDIPGINEIATYGLDTIDPEATIEVKLKDLLYIYKTIEELNRFLHQPMHYKTIETVHQYMGNRDQGAFSLIHNIYYNIFDRMLPQSVKDFVEDDKFQHPAYPFYYKP